MFPNEKYEQASHLHYVSQQAANVQRSPRFIRAVIDCTHKQRAALSARELP